MEGEGVMPECCNALETLACNVCDGYVGVGRKQGICRSLAESSFGHCSLMMFEAGLGQIGAAGSIKACTENSLTCSRLTDILESVSADPAALASLFVTSLGYSVAEEGTGTPCYDGSRIAAPEGWEKVLEAAETTIEAAQEDNAKRTASGSVSWRPWHWSVDRWIGEVRARSARGDPALLLPVVTIAVGVLSIQLLRGMQEKSRRAALMAAYSGYGDEEARRAERLRRFQAAH